MLWVLLAFTSAATLGLRRFQEKELLINTPIKPLSVAWATRFFAVFFLAALAFWQRETLFIPESISFWLATAVVVFIFYPVFAYCGYRALAEGELSKTTPVLSFTPVFALVIAWIFRGEQPDVQGIIGIFAIAFSMYLLHAHRHEKIWQPFIDIIRDIPTRLTLIVSFGLAVSVNLDKVAIEQSGPITYALINVVGAVLVISFMDKIRSRTALGRVIAKHWPILLLIGFLDSIIFMTYIFALNIAPYTSYVIAIRDMSIFIAAGLGILFIKEKASLGVAASYLIAIVGILLLVL